MGRVAGGLLCLALAWSPVAFAQTADEAACTGGDEVACVRVGDVLRHAEGATEESLARAVALYRHACAAGKREGCYGLGVLLRRGVDGPPDLDAAAQAFERACDLAHAWSCNDLGTIFDSCEPADPARAAALFRRACELGSGVACGNYAEDLATGRGVAKDVAAAAHHFELACLGETHRSCVPYAEHVARGDLGDAADVSHALAIYRVACDHDDGIACARLGNALRHGITVRRDVPRARALLERGCDLHADASCNDLGLLLSEAPVTPELTEEVTDLYSRACDGGVDVACMNVAVVRPDLALPHPDWVTQLLRDACGRHDGQACGDLAAWVESGRAPDAPASAAPALWRSACESGLGSACYVLYRRAAAAHTPDADAFRERACRGGVEAACPPPAGHAPD